MDAAAVPYQSLLPLPVFWLSSRRDLLLYPGRSLQEAVTSSSSLNAAISFPFPVPVILTERSEWKDPPSPSLPLLFAPRRLQAAGRLLLFLFPTALLAQTSTHVQPQPAPAAFTDTIAGAFITARANAHLRPLSRIPDRPLLRRIVCSAAANNSATGRNEGNATFISRESQADGALVSVTDLTHLPAAIRRVAEYDDRSTARGRRITRFSVAAFISPEDPSVTWVGVALYWSRLTEYVALHLTRSYTPPDLRYDLAPPCVTIP